MRKFYYFILFLFISCANDGEIAILEVTVSPDPSYIYVDDSLAVKVCEAKVKLEEKGGVGVYFVAERINYIDMETGEIFYWENLDANKIKEVYGYNYLPANGWAEIEIKDMIPLSSPDNFYVEDTVYCRDAKENYFKIYYKRRCLSTQK